MSDRYRDDTDRGATTEAAKEEASQLGDEVRQEAGRVTEEAKHQGRVLMDETQTRVREEADRQTERTASGLRSMSGELRSMADNSDQPQSNVATWVRRGAEEIDSFANRLDRDGVDGVIRDVSDFARRNPTTFLVTTFGLGLLAGRVMKNRDGDQSSPSDDRGFREDRAMGDYRSRVTESSTTPEPTRPPRGAAVPERPRP